MRRITMWILGTVSGLVLLFTYRTSTMGPAVGIGGGADAGTTTATGESATGSGAGSGRSGAAGGATDQTVKGSVANTRWGPVQVQVKISGGRITDVTTLQAPAGNRRDKEINDYAVPVLRKEALAAQSADIDTVSGATVTSNGYQQSLQAALDSANFRG
jgi:uncharacterized protein with FMN-binding domain